MRFQRGAFLGTAHPGQLVLVVVKMNNRAAGNSREALRRLEVRASDVALHLDRADEILAKAGGEPFFDPLMELGRVAGDVAEKPVHLAYVLRLQCENVAAQEIDAGHVGDALFQRRRVDGQHARAKPRQRPGPAAGARAGVEAALAGRGPFAQPRQRFPQLQVGAAGRAFPVPLELDRAARKGAGAAGAGDHDALAEQRPRADRGFARRPGEGARLRANRRQL